MKRTTLLLLVTILFCITASAQISGCTDPLATNHNAQATINDGSCTYAAASVSPSSSVNLPPAIKETSGLIVWNDHLFTHNDNTDKNIYALDTISGAVLQSVTLSSVTNQDWEEISQDESHLYIGDFGNNGNGNRTNLKIIKVDKNSLGTALVTGIINFSYSNQTSLTATGNNNTDFDCEAFVVSQDSIYLFTKQWVTKMTSVYALPKTPGTHVAQLKATFNVNGLITGATYLEDKNVIVLSGYSNTLQPFLYLLYDFNGHDFFSGNKRKLNVPLAFHQIEGVATKNGLDYFATNENFVQAPFVNVPQKLHRFNLRPYLKTYVQTALLASPNLQQGSNVRIYPNPTGDFVYVEGDADMGGMTYLVVDMTGKKVLSGTLGSLKNKLDISSIAAGAYYIMIPDKTIQPFKLIKKD
jgi:hypothetical protein